MRETSMSEQDKEFIELRDQVFKAIPPGIENSAKWEAFQGYMYAYYKKLPSHTD